MFIQIFQGRCTQPDRARELSRRWLDEVSSGADGWLGMTYGITDDDMYIAVVRFESPEAAAENSARPEQSQWWAEMEQCFDGPVEFHDCKDVSLMLDGGSDEAGFVQIIQGRVSDPERFKETMGSDLDQVQQMRPEILGATLAFEPDGTFTQTVAFTDEVSARRGEEIPMPQQSQAHWDELVQDVHYLDLHQPGFASRS